jgi:hypothetical protein
LFLLVNLIIFIVVTLLLLVLFSPTLAIAMHARKVISFLSALVLVVCISATADDAPSITPLPQAHAHNDYEHPRPLFDALDHGFCSVEADIWLTTQGLMIGHNQQDLRPGRTLQSLYLDPLRERIKSNGGRVYPAGPTFYLLIDIKSDGGRTFAALDQVLNEYQEILTTYRDHKGVEVKAVTVVISGNRAADLIAAPSVRYAAIDGRPEDLDSNPPSHLYPWISANWTLLFKWNGDGSIPVADKQRLTEFVQRAHEQGRKVRFWATPEKESVWKELVSSGVDFVNTDKLDELQAYLRQR